MSKRARTEGGENLVDRLEDIHGVENVIVDTGGVVISQDCDCERCSA